MPEVLWNIFCVIGRVFLGILKVLLIILLVILILVCLLLFTPFTYRADVHKHGDRFCGKAGLNWLWFVLRFRARFGDGPIETELYLFGIPLLRLIRSVRDGRNRRRRAGRHAAPERYAGAKKKPTVPPGGRETAAQSGTRGTAGQSGTREAAGQSGERGPEERTSQKTREKEGRKFRLFQKHRKRGRGTTADGPDSQSKIKEVCGKIKYGIGILKSEENQPAFAVIKEHGKKFLRHILPRKIEGTVAFGFDDPSSTGEALGVLSWILPVLPEGLSIEPDFTEKKLEADVSARGHFFLIALLKEALSILMNKDVKKMIRDLREKSAAGSGR